MNGERITISLMRISSSDLSNIQAIPHCVCAKSGLLPNFHEGQSRRVQTHHRIDDSRRWRLATHRDSNLLKPFCDGRAMTVKFSSYLVHRGSYFVACAHPKPLSFSEPPLSLTDWAK